MDIEKIDDLAKEFFALKSFDEKLKLWESNNLDFCKIYSKEMGTYLSLEPNSKSEIQAYNEAFLRKQVKEIFNEKRELHSQTFKISIYTFEELQSDFCKRLKKTEHKREKFLELERQSSWKFWNEYDENVRKQNKGVNESYQRPLFEDEYNKTVRAISDNISDSCLKLDFQLWMKLIYAPYVKYLIFLETFEFGSLKEEQKKEQPKGRQSHNPQNQPTQAQWGLFCFYLQEIGEIEWFENHPNGVLKSIEEFSIEKGIGSQKNFQLNYNQVKKVEYRHNPANSNNIKKVIEMLKDFPKAQEKAKEDIRKTQQKIGKSLT